jgi:methylated-DNA-[protein]-cysteine S-methyltransferase
MGTVVLGVRADGDLWTDWPDRFGHPWPEDASCDHSCCEAEAELLTRYFDGEPVDPATARCATPDGTAFHHAAWAACRAVPRGSTMTYAQLAEAAGAPNAARAAGTAMRSNPLPLFIPCHRIVAADGGIGGFAGMQDASSSAVRLKYELLDFEAALAHTRTSPVALVASS